MAGCPVGLGFVLTGVAVVRIAGVLVVLVLVAAVVVIVFGAVDIL